MNEQMFFVGRKDGYLYGYLNENDHTAQWVGNEGTPIKMTLEVAQKLFGVRLIDYELILVK